MHVVRTIAQLRQCLSAYRASLPDATVGFVPTMGNLHAGHLALVAASADNQDCTVVSIFVNPLQFGPQEDFSTYPRTLSQDITLLEKQGKAAILFCPDVAELQPESEAGIAVVPTTLPVPLCAGTRPALFSGALTVLTQLFHLVQPDTVFLGQKDLQQYALVKRCLHALHFPIKAVMVSTVRQANGLALSSRNTYLTEKETQVAPQLHATLCDLEQVFLSLPEYPEPGSQSAKRWLTHCRHCVWALSDMGFNVEYLELCVWDTLCLPHKHATEWALLVAAHLGKTRLIDNVLFQHSFVP